MSATTIFIIAIVAGVGAVAADRAIAIRDRLGASGALITVTAMQTLLIASMALCVNLNVARTDCLPRKSLEDGCGREISM